MNKIKILNLATTDQGGAGVASLYFNNLFNHAGHQSLLVVKDSKYKNDNVIVLDNKIQRVTTKIIPKLNAEFHKFFKLNSKNQFFDSKYYFFNKNENKQTFSAKQILKKVPFRPDVIIFHSISGFINTKTINEFAKVTQAKTFWLLMDNAPFTGGCHYPWNCKGFHSVCTNCPAILKREKKQIASTNLALKIKNLPDNIEIITCSELDYTRAMNSILFKQKKIHKILFPINESIFKPSDKTKAKTFFGISSGKKVVLFGASTFSNIRKGNQYFIDSILIVQEQLKSEQKSLSDFVILVAGKGEKEKFNKIEIPVIFTNYLTENELITAYQAADVFVSTSIEDSGPTMIKQSIMCGTPVVSFKMGVAFDLVITTKTGYLAELKNANDLALGIINILSLNSEKYQRISENCRNLALSVFSEKRQLSKFLTAFRL